MAARRQLSGDAEQVQEPLMQKRRLGKYTREISLRLPFNGDIEGGQ